MAGARHSASDTCCLHYWSCLGNHSAAQGRSTQVPARAVLQGYLLPAGVRHARGNPDEYIAGRQQRSAPTGGSSLRGVPGGGGVDMDYATGILAASPHSLAVERMPMLLIVCDSILVFLLGAATASHVGLIAYRLPRKEQFLKGRSRCESCNRLLAWWEEIPCFGWLICRGKCPSCGYKIPVRYPLLELLGGLIVTVVYLLFR